MVMGGWSKFSPISKEGKEILKEALGTPLGVKYEGFAMATQVVEGHNYKFLCNAETVTLKGHDYVAEILVYCAPKKGPELISINITDC